VNQIKQIFLLIITFFVNSMGAAAVDLVVFSKDRPLQLYGFLESCDIYITGLDKTTVIYCSSSAKFDAGYQIVREAFPRVKFVKQSANPKADFKRLTCEAVFSGASPYILFAVDDIVVIDRVDLERCVKALGEQKAYAFYLRLGLDITECYMEKRVTGLPVLRAVADDMYTWKFVTGTGDWGYPHSVDMTLYRKRHIKKAFLNMTYTMPNWLEAHWAAQAYKKQHLYGLCFKESKIINMPLNIVQKEFNNINAGTIDVQTLLEKFMQGFKIDVEALHRLPHKAPHVDHIPTLKAR
jgi:hypothetical protein